MPGQRLQLDADREAGLTEGGDGAAEGWSGSDRGNDAPNPAGADLGQIIGSSTLRFPSPPQHLVQVPHLRGRKPHKQRAYLPS